MSPKASFTAEIVAFARAAGSLYRDPAIRNGDYLARNFLNRPFAVALLPGLRAIATLAYEHKVPGVYRYLHLRTRAIDEILEGELAHGIEQFCIVGSGLDSRAYRYRDQLKGVRVFECDHPAMAAVKQQRLRRWGGDTSHVTYVNVDLVGQSLEQSLTEAGFDPNARSFILCEGLFCYLPEEPVQKILALVAKTAPGTSLVFDYIMREVYSAPEGHYGAKELYRYLERTEEPIRSTISHQELPSFLRPFGLEIVSNVQATSLEDRFLRRSNGRLLAPVCATYAIAHARRRI